MELLSRRAFLPLLALILLSAVFIILVPTRIHGGGTPSVLLVSSAPTDPLSPPIDWVENLDHRLKTYFKKKYPAYDFAPYAQELNRIREAVSLGDRWAAKREVGVFLKMLANRAYGLGDDAAEELTVLSHQIMPDEEFGIVYPGSEPDPSTAARRAADCNEPQNSGGRIDHGFVSTRDGSHSWSSRTLTGM